MFGVWLDAGYIVEGGLKAGRTMRRLGNLIEHLPRWISRYRLALNYGDARDRRRNGKMIGELRRRSSDA